MKQRASRARHLGQKLDREDRAGLVVGPHHGRDRGTRSQRAPKGLDVQAATCIHGDEMAFDTAAAQLFDQRQHGGMLHGGGDDLVPSFLSGER